MNLQIINGCARTDAVSPPTVREPNPRRRYEVYYNDEKVSALMALII